ncbi:MAG: chloride channel protein [Thermodesulfobacteriota bacterium]|nr:chloride channel protein [Thermodesulfobacteriota bacterium]
MELKHSMLDNIIRFLGQARAIFVSRQAKGISLFYFMLIGIIAGIGSIVFQFLCDAGLHFFLDHMAGYRPSGPTGEPHLFHPTQTPFNRWVLLVLPAIGGIVSGWLVYTFAPEAEGHGTDAAIDAYHNKGGFIRHRVPFIKTIASAITLTTGGSGGREGPIAQIGAGFGSFLATKLKLSDRQRRIMLAAGVSAGVGSIFRAPLAGALFAAEVLYRDPEFEADVLIPAGLASVVAYCLFCLVYGWGTLFTSPDYRFANPAELGPYVVLALLLTGVSFLYVQIFYGVERFFKSLRIPLHLKPALGGLLTGGVGFFLPETLAFGYGVLQDALFNEVGIFLLLGVAFGKILTTSFTISSGGSGGVFGPSVVIGGALGGAVGQMFHKLIPGIIQAPQVMVVLGMAGFFTAISNAPISTIIFVAEMTNSYQMLLPALLVCLLCYQLSPRWSIYRQQVKNRAASPAHAGEFFVDILQTVKVRDLEQHIRTVSCVPESMNLTQFKLFFTSTTQPYFPVVDQQERLTGIFSHTDLRKILFDAEMESLIVVKDIATSDIIRTTLEEDLNEVMNKFTMKNIEAIPVVYTDAPDRLIGMLRRKEVIAFYNEKVQAMREQQQG